MHLLTPTAVAAALLLAPHASAEGMYPKNSPVLQIDNKNWQKLIVDSHVPSIVEFYAPWCGHCQNLKPAYEKAAKSLEGVVQVAAVNCDDDDNKALCGSQGIKGFPTLKTVRPLGIKGKPVMLPYQGERSAKALVEAGKALLPNEVKRVEDKDLEGWLADKNETAKAILFSDKGKTPAQLKAIANDFYGNLNVGQIRDKDQKAADMFGIEDYPTLIVLPGGDKAPVKYEGEMNMIDMAAFVKQYAGLRTDWDSKPSKQAKSKDTKAKSSKASKSYEKAASSHAKEEATEVAESDEPAKAEDSSAAPPRETVEPLRALSTETELKEACLGEKTSTCLLAFLPATKEASKDQFETTTAAVGNLAQLQQQLHTGAQHIFPFYIVMGENEFGSTVKKSLGLKESELEIITVNGKRGWWRHYDSAKGFEVLALEDWVDGIKFGEGKKEKLPAELLGGAEEKVEDEEKSEL